MRVYVRNGKFIGKVRNVHSTPGTNRLLKMITHQTMIIRFNQIYPNRIPTSGKSLILKIANEIGS